MKWAILLAACLVLVCGCARQQETAVPEQIRVPPREFAPGEEVPPPVQTPHTLPDNRPVLYLPAPWLDVTDRDDLFYHVQTARNAGVWTTLLPDLPDSLIKDKKPRE